MKCTSLSPSLSPLSVSVLQVSLLTVTLVYYVYYIYHSIVILEVVELLQRCNHRGHVDVSLLAAWEQVRETKEINEGREKDGWRGRNTNI